MLPHRSGRRARNVGAMSNEPDPNRAANAVVAILGSAGIAHFVVPRFFDQIVPDWVPGSKRFVTYASGAVEVLAAVLVLNRRTRRLGGWLALATFAGVYPANVQAALDGGMKGAPPPWDSPAAAWARLPLQLPMFWLAWKVIRSHANGAAGANG